MKNIGQIQVIDNMLIFPKELIRYLMVIRYGKVPKRKLVRKRRLKLLITESLKRSLELKKLDKVNKV
jgi:hypothetical protein